MVSLGLTWVSLGHTWTHLTHSSPLGLTWTHLDSLDSLDHTREKGRPPAAKGKGESPGRRFEARSHLRTSRAHARTTRNETIAPLVSPPNLRDIYMYIHVRGCSESPYCDWVASLLLTDVGNQECRNRSKLFFQQHPKTMDSTPMLANPYNGKWQYLGKALMGF